MQNKFPPGLMLPMEQQNNPAFNVVIAYENAAAGLRAMRIFSKLADDHRGELAFQTQIWRFDVLDDPVWRKKAEKDAMKADMLVISIESEAELPASVQGWLTAYQSQKSRGSRAVVALFGTEEDGGDANSLRLKLVKRSAEEAGLYFFAPLPHHKTNLGSDIESLDPSLGVTNGNSYDLGDQSEGYQHWGINE